jgi:tetratricopeptide (TPR) repeat protein
METAMSFRPGITMQDMALPLARQYFSSGEYAKALPYYQASIAAMQDAPLPDVVLEAGSVYDEVGDCRRALLYYDQYRGLILPYQRSEVDWKIGSCSQRLARALRAEGEDEEALFHIERTIELGQPRSDQASAYLEMAEILSDLGRCQDAMDAYLQVPRVDQTGTSSQVDVARWRYDQLRFQGPAGGGLGYGC